MHDQIRNALLMARNADANLRGPRSGRTSTAADDANLRRTGRDCHVCEDGEFLRDGSELRCDSCQYVPSSDEPQRTRTPWEKIRAERKQARENDDRPYCIGGYPGAYWGDGEYEYSPVDGFQYP